MTKSKRKLVKKAARRLARENPTVHVPGLTVVHGIVAKRAVEKRTSPAFADNLLPDGGKVTVGVLRGGIISAGDVAKLQRGTAAPQRPYKDSAAAQASALIVKSEVLHRQPNRRPWRMPARSAAVACCRLLSLSRKVSGLVCGGAGAARDGNDAQGQWQ